VPVPVPVPRNHHIFGCRSAASLQKLTLRRQATTNERLGLLSC
jgi:hypothetical protein